MNPRYTDNNAKNRLKLPPTYFLCMKAGEKENEPANNTDSAN